MKKKFIAIILGLLMLSCKDNNKPKGKIAVYPLSPYRNYLFARGGIPDTLSIWLSFVVYNVDEDKLGDPVYIKNILKPFADSIMLHYPEMMAFQINFFKQFEDLDTTFREVAKDNELYMHSGDQIAIYMNWKDGNIKYWIVSKGREHINIYE